MDENPIRELLLARFRVKNRIRHFFAERDVLEIDAPALTDAGVTDPQIENILAQVNGQTWYLQSSPEYFMKRLLAAGSGSIYSLNFAYRDGESGRRHRPEFLMLEWYRVGWDENRLMEEVAEFFNDLGLKSAETVTLEYCAIFYKVTGIDPLACDDRTLQALASEVAGSDFSRESRSICLDLIFSLLVEPALPEGLVFIKDFPPCQAALARLGQNAGGQRIARRFEAFFNRLELANGYFELDCARELKARFEADQRLRKTLGKPGREMDQNLLKAMETGFPECSGVALGVDRLIMTLLGKAAIQEVYPFG